MAMIGSQNKLLVAKLNLAYDYMDEISKTQQMINRNAELKGISIMVKNMGASKSIEDIINIEKIMLQHEKATYNADNLNATGSINEALKELERAKNSLEIVNDKNKYSDAVATHSPKERDLKRGLPKDAFHTFANAHKTRLGNRILTTESSFEERLILTERHNNIKIALNEYMKLQAIALNIPMKENSKEIER